MDLRSHYPYWLLRHGIVKTYPSLTRSIKTDVVVMGGGISGALTAWNLHQEGFKVTVLDRRHIGMGSTVASTALLQYELDTPLHELQTKIGERTATRSYLLCLEAIEKVKRLAKQLKLKDSFRSRPSLQFASHKKNRSSLIKEFEVRKKAGIRLEWLESEDIVDKFGFAKPCGLLSADGAELDPYSMTHALLSDCLADGMEVYDHTEVVNIQHNKSGLKLITDGNWKITARKLVIACGYESQRYIPKKIQQLHSTYAIISEANLSKEPWYRNALIWETDNPYIYLRTTKDGRILIGGKDIPSSDPNKRDALIPQKTKALEKAFSKLFPSLPFRTDFHWAGSFGTTKDSLPYIGSIPERPNTYFALGLGGNGITFSVIAAEIIRDLVSGKENRDTTLFSFQR